MLLLNLVTSGAVQTAIDNALVGGVIYKGTWDAAGQTDYSVSLPVKERLLILCNWFCNNSVVLNGRRRLLNR